MDDHRTLHQRLPVRLSQKFKKKMLEIDRWYNVGCQMNLFVAFVE